MSHHSADVPCPHCFRIGFIHLEQVIRGADVMRVFRCTACEYEWETALALAFLDDWEMAARANLNVLVLGAAETTAALVIALRQHLVAPVITVNCTQGLALPSGLGVATLVLLDVWNLVPADQRRLRIWLEHAPPRIISTSPASILSMVDGGLFLESLYSRLNTVCIDASVLTPHRPGQP